MTLLEHRSTRAGNHPATMPAVVSLELWERFSFYGMQAILAYYLYYSATDGGLGMATEQATASVGAYGAFVYLCTIAGGWIGDRLLGPEKTLLAGALVLVAGHSLLGLIPGVAGLMAGLLLIAFGSGSLKTAAITVLGFAYSPSEPARDVAFQLFYLSINIGAFFGPLLTGWLATAYGFHHGFTAAAILMTVGVFVYLTLRRRLLIDLSPEVTAILTKPRAPVSALGAVLLGLATAGVLAALIALFISGVLTPARLTFTLLIGVVAIAAAMFWTIHNSPHTRDSERSRVRAFIPLFVCSIVFWCLQAQLYGVLAVYSDVRLDRQIFGWVFPASWTQSLNPVFILLFTFPLAWLWLRLADRRPTGHVKMPVGLLIAGTGPAVLLPFTGGGPSSTPLLLFVACIGLISLGEMFIGPVGMEETSRHAPAAFATRFSALFYLSMAIGTSLAGTLSVFYDPSNATLERIYLVAMSFLAFAVSLGMMLLRRR